MHRTSYFPHKKKKKLLKYQKSENDGTTLDEYYNNIIHILDQFLINYVPLT